MSRPILVYTIISSFMVPWTDFVMAKMILNSGLSADWTVAIGLYNMLQKTLINNYFALFCAGGVLVSIPISILFVIMQKFYVEGITFGADKGQRAIFFLLHHKKPHPAGRPHGSGVRLLYAPVPHKTVKT